MISGEILENGEFAYGFEIHSENLVLGTQNWFVHGYEVWTPGGFRLYGMVDSTPEPVHILSKVMEDVHEQLQTMATRTGD